jgi:putative phage-type endonuclease
MFKKIPNISARDFATILNINPYQTPFQLLESKIENKYPFFGNKFTDHGNRYEGLAIKTYAEKTGNNVDSNQKNSKHSDYDWITGRFDGIVSINSEEECEVNFEILQEEKRKRRKIEEDDKNQKFILEVKCPLKKDRNEPLTLESIPIYYWSQCQVYMNMLDCENAHYVEYYIEPDASEDSGILYIIDVKRDRKWWNESLPIIMKYRKEMAYYHEKGSLDTHPVRIAEKEWEKMFL